MPWKSVLFGLLLSLVLPAQAAVNYLVITFDASQNLNLQITSSCSPLNGNSYMKVTASNYFMHFYGIPDIAGGVLIVSGSGYYVRFGNWPLSIPAYSPRVCVAGVPSSITVTPSGVDVGRESCLITTATPKTTITLGGAITSFNACQSVATNGLIGSSQVVLPDGFNVYSLSTNNGFSASGAYMPNSLVPGNVNWGGTHSGYCVTSSSYGFGAKCQETASPGYDFGSYGYSTNWNGFSYVIGY